MKYRVTHVRNPKARCEVVAGSPERAREIAASLLKSDSRLMIAVEQFEAPIDPQDELNCESCQ